MNVELVSKTKPNREYFKRRLEELADNEVITHEEKNAHLDNLDAEQLMIYIARVSSDRDNKLEDYSGLLNYLIDNGHWSPFQMADMTVEIKTSRAMARQMIRHRSFKFQEFSQRYSEATEFEDVELREQPENNRQSSSERLADITYNEYNENDFLYRYPEDGEVDKNNKQPTLLKTKEALTEAKEAYHTLIENGVSSETARMILPECTTTTLYMKGSIRSWIHYLDLRNEEATQKEHRQVAQEIGKIFQQEFPVIANALDFDYG